MAVAAAGMVVVRWPLRWRQLKASLLFLRGYPEAVCLAASAPRRDKHEARLANAYKLWQSLLPLPARLAPASWAAGLCAAHADQPHGVVRALTTVANALFKAAGAGPLTAFPAVKDMLSNFRTATVAPPSSHAVFDLLAFVRLVCTRLPFKQRAPLIALRRRACTLLLCTTLWRSSDVARLAVPESATPARVVLRVTYGKSARLARAARASALSPPSVIECRGQRPCTHCAVLDYWTATQQLARPPFADLLHAVEDPPRPLFVSHGSGAAREISADTAKDTAKPLVRSLGVPGADVHSLRSLVASACVSYGVSKEVVCSWGQWDAATFARFYDVVGTTQFPPAQAPRVALFPGALVDLALSPLQV